MFHKRINSSGAILNSSSDVNSLEESERALSKAAGELIDTTGALSAFDVGMSHMSQQLMRFSKELADVSDSNLAIVQETTASASLVSDNVQIASNTLDMVTEDAKMLSKRTEESRDLLSQARDIKDEMVEDMRQMTNEMKSLLGIVEEVNSIVEKVQSIASQTNLLALNASIEAARAGEMGKGFAVVAEEVRKLADDTNTQLKDMRMFVEQMNKVTTESRESLKKSVDSGKRMGEMIEGVNDSVKANTDELIKIVEEFNSMNASVMQIKNTMVEINSVMDSSAQDAQSLVYMASGIHDEAVKGVDYAAKLSDIDDEISRVIDEMYTQLKGTKNAPSNDKVIDILEKAKIAHSNWIGLLHDMADKGVDCPIQINPQKCAFGHYYYALNIDQGELGADWKRIGTLHSTLHTYGKTLKNKLESPREDRLAIYKEAEDASKQLVEIIDHLISGLKSMKCDILAK